MAMVSKISCMPQGMKKDGGHFNGKRIRLWQCQARKAKPNILFLL